MITQKKVTAVYKGPECKWFVVGDTYALKLTTCSKDGILFNTIGGRKVFPCRNFLKFMEWWDEIKQIN